MSVELTDDMCPNCVTPWKCNGPHVPAEAAPTGRVHPDPCPSPWHEAAPPRALDRAKEAAFDALGRTCDWSLSPTFDRCKDEAVDFRQRAGSWVPVCAVHAPTAEPAETGS